MALRLLLAWLLLAGTAEAQIRPRWATAQASPVQPNPSCTIDTPTASSTYSTSTSAITIGGTCIDQDGTVTQVVVSCATCTPTSQTDLVLEGNRYEVTFTAQTAGANTLSVQATDNALNTSTAITLVSTFDASDSTAPVVTIVTNAGVNFSDTDGTITLAGTAVDAVGITSVIWQLDGEDVDTDPDSSGSCSGLTAWTCDPIALLSCSSECLNNLTIRACDQATNCGTDTIVVTFDVPLRVTTTTLANCSLNTACTLHIDATGGSGTYSTFAKQSGNYLTCTPAFAIATAGNRGVITGTCTSSGQTETSVVFRVTDSAAATADSAELTLRCVDPTAQTYFDTIGALTEAMAFTECVENGDVKGCSFDNAAQITALLQHPEDTDVYTYDATEEAAKLTIAATERDGTNDMRPSIAVTSGKVLFVYDRKYDSSYKSTACNGNIDPSVAGGLGFKETQIAMSPLAASDGSISLEQKLEVTLGGLSLAPSCDYVGVVAARLYFHEPLDNIVDLGYATDELQPPKGKTGGRAGAGTELANTWAIAADTWTRQWVEVKLNVPCSDATSWASTYSHTLSATETCHVYSHWIADETREPVRLVYDAPVQRTVTPKAIATLTCSGTTATLTSSQAHAIDTGTYFYVHGASPSSYNGVFQPLTIPSATTLTYTVASCTGAGSGTMTVSKVREGIAKFWYEHDTSNDHKAAQGTVTITGTVGTVVPNNTILSRAAQGSCGAWQYKTDNAVTIPASGSISVVAIAKPQSVYGGPCGNADAGTVLTTSVVGVSGVAVASGGLTGGRYLFDGPLLSWSRWFHVLRNYTLPATPEDDTVLFARPVP